MKFVKLKIKFLHSQIPKSIFWILSFNYSLMDFYALTSQFKARFNFWLGLLRGPKATKVLHKIKAIESFQLLFMQ